jgi:hypothetical protein
MATSWCLAPHRVWSINWSIAGGDNQVLSTPLHYERQSVIATRASQSCLMSGSGLEWDTSPAWTGR